MSLQESYQEANLVGSKIDVAITSKNKQDLLCLDGLQAIKASSTNVTLQALFLYFESNIHAALDEIAYVTDSQRWEWLSEHFERAFILNRQCVQHSGFKCLPPAKQGEVLTNLANQLKFLGRLTESFECYHTAISIAPSNSMHHGNLGMGLYYMHHMIYNNYDAACYLNVAHKHLSLALENNGPDLFDDAKAAFERSIDEIDAKASKALTSFIIPTIDTNKAGLPAKSQYLNWAATQCLSLNLCADLGPIDAGIGDLLRLPSILEPKGQIVRPYGAFNQIKLQFAAARFGYWRYLRNADSEIADQELHLIDTLDSPAYGIRFEDLRTAFRLGYSVFDQIAYLLNDYLQLGVEKDAVTFKTLWYQNNKQGRKINAKLYNIDNLPLRGLFWLARDLGEGPKGRNPGTSLYKSLEPEAMRLAEIRNEIEHKYLKVFTPANEGFGSVNLFSDQLAKGISTDEFAQKTIKILRLARSAIIYTALVIQREEVRKRAAIPKDKLVMPIEFPPFRC